MSDCVNCGRALQPAWKYCIYCGTRTTRAAAPARTSVPALVTVASTARTSVVPVAAPAPLAIAPESLRVTPASTAPVSVPLLEGAGRVNPLSVLALILGILASPFAALFGHVALGQLRESRERGVAAAWAAIVLGYLWLGFFLVLGISYLATNG
jgi:hypothetical protein